jgi:hypothetical protein
VRPSATEWQTCLCRSNSNRTHTSRPPETSKASRL